MAFSAQIEPLTKMYGERATAEFFWLPENGTGPQVVRHPGQFAVGPRKCRCGAHTYIAIWLVAAVAVGELSDFLA